MIIYRIVMLLVMSKALVIQEYFTQRVDCGTMILSYDLVYANRTASSLLGCASLCLFDPDCESLNFLRFDICMLSNKTLDDSCSNRQDNVNGIYLVRFQEKNASVCLNGGIMKPTNTCLCFGGYIGDFCERIMEDCTEGVPYYPGEFGTFLIHPRLSPKPFKAVCRMAFDKRTYLQIRHYGGNETLFVQNWEAYKNGFGDISETDDWKRNFWLGNENAYYLTNSKDYHLIVQLAEYHYTSFGQYRLNYFVVKSEEDNYSMSYTTAYPYLLSIVFGNSMLSSNGANFSTFDRDNDIFPGNCAQKHGTGWWFASCSRCNPNGRLWPGGINVRLNVDDEFFWEDGLNGWSAWGTSMWLSRH
ncbi:angiopoietin-related protein 1-like [Mizuhopecten yessoensis]|uniref:Angiopoietin-related protein 1 n=1 Tax=Mizuhopecten yessoensis TaxID=6573 RepID=A0A210PFF8_MIZYE|nr:angiopoietin-related protein 1-like [Mizuhopecten yessoensis]OWF35225.1 Angiopoietin-related protein 1 [Mizuhopecten yessoensis]